MICTGSKTLTDGSLALLGLSGFSELSLITGSTKRIINWITAHIRVKEVES